MKQAQSSLEQKDFTKARYLFLQGYKSLLERRRLYTKPSIAEQKRRTCTIAKTIIRKHSSFAGK